MGCIAMTSLHTICSPRLVTVGSAPNEGLHRVLELGCLPTFDLGHPSQAFPGTAAKRQVKAL
jgi:hypothetical protein